MCERGQKRKRQSQLTLCEDLDAESWRTGASEEVDCLATWDLRLLTSCIKVLLWAAVSLKKGHTSCTYYILCHTKNGMLF